MRLSLLLGCALVLLTARVGSSVEQEVVAIVPPGEQQVVPINPPREQMVQDVGGETGTQQVEQQEPPSPGAKMASNVAKGATAVGAAAVSLAAMTAMLIFL